MSDQQTMLVKCIKDTEGWWTEGEMYPVRVEAGGFIVVGDDDEPNGEGWSASPVEYRDAIQCMLDHDTENTLHFVDPPYIHDTRVNVAKNSAYRHEMTNVEHLALLEEIKALQGMVIICGYDSDLYNDALSSWRRVTRTTSANGQSGSVPRTECLWINQSAQQAERAA